MTNLRTFQLLTQRCQRGAWGCKSCKGTEPGQLGQTQHCLGFSQQPSASCITYFVYSFTISMSPPFFSVLLNCLYFNPHVFVPFTPLFLPPQHSGECGEVEWTNGCMVHRCLLGQTTAQVYRIPCFCGYTTSRELYLISCSRLTTTAESQLCTSTNLDNVRRVIFKEAVLNSLRLSSQKRY